MDRCAPEASLQPGSTLDHGKYRVVRLLGRGGMGSVYEAENTLTQKRVAIKWMHAELSKDRAAAERLLREAQAGARVRHPNVVDVYDVGREGDALFLVLEYLEGEPLSRRLERDSLPMHQAVALLLPALRAVAAAHKHGVVHRDLKPDNIFLANEPDARLPVPKVLDFGVSKLERGEAAAVTLTRSGTVVGTPRYMSYEQLNGDKSIDGKTDVYAFGVILYEVLTGRPPHEAESFAELILKVATVTPAPPHALRPEIPTSLSQLVLWCLAKERGERIGVEELLRELEPFATERGFLAHVTLSDEAPSHEAAGVVSTPAVAVRTSAPPVEMARAVAAVVPRWRSAWLAAALLGLTLLAVWALRPSRSPQASPPALPQAAAKPTVISAPPPAHDVIAPAAVTVPEPEAHPPAASSKDPSAAPPPRSAPSPGGLRVPRQAQPRAPAAIPAQVREAPPPFRVRRVPQSSEF